MKNTYLILPFLMSILMAVSCVNRIDIPEEEEAKFFLKCEMVRGQQITAELTTSNNLNGSNPIMFPENAEITIYRAGQFEVVSNFVYDSELGKYVYLFDGNQLLRPNYELIIEAEVRNSSIPPVTSQTRVPNFGDYKAFELVSQEKTIVDGQKYFLNTLRIAFMDLNSTYDQFYHIALFDRASVREIVGNDTTYTFLSDAVPLELVKVNSGLLAVEDVAHMNGFFVNVSEMEDEFIEIVVRSTTPITLDDQVNDHILSEFNAVSKEHYLHHRSKSNMVENAGSIFTEPALYHSNIKNGIGLFSSCVSKKSTLKIQ